MRTIVATLLILLVSSSLFAEDEPDQSKISTIISVFSSGNAAKISGLLSFPIEREYPLPPIADASEFTNAYGEIVDDPLLTRIKQSQIASDWSIIGWRGLQFGNGTLWLDEHYKIYAINYRTPKGDAHWRELVERQRNSLPIELRKFDKPILEWTSAVHRLRVDQIGTTYRLVRWPKSTTTQYDMVLFNGEFRFDGQLGAFQIVWKSGKKTVTVEVMDDGKHFGNYFKEFNSTSYEDNPDSDPETIEEMKSEN